MSNIKFTTYDGITSEYIFERNPSIPFQRDIKELGAKYNRLANQSLSKVEGVSKEFFNFNFPFITSTQLIFMWQYKSLSPFRLYLYPDFSPTAFLYVYIVNDYNSQRKTSYINKLGVDNNLYSTTIQLEEA